MLKPGQIRCMLEIDSTSVGTRPMAKLDKEMTPILSELISLGSENYNNHPTVKELFNWLVASDRTGEEFYYIVGPLQEYVLKVMKMHFRQYIDPIGPYAGIPGMHLGKAAAEALAVICPILEGPWEQVAWVLLKESTSNSPEDYGWASNKLTAWIFHVIGDPGLCPNPYIRYELIHFLAYLVEPVEHENFRPQAVESFLSACSFLNIDYLMESHSQRNYYHQMDVCSLMDCLNCITINIDQEFDASLAKKLQNVKTLRLSAHLHDFAYHYAIHSNTFNEPMMLYGLTAILKTIYDYIQLNYKDYQNKNSQLILHFSSICSTSRWLKMFINNFPKSCLTPHLIGLTASCILTTMETVMSEFVIMRRREVLSNISIMLIDLFDENLFTFDIESPESMTVMAKYKKRLNHLKINNWCFD